MNAERMMRVLDDAREVASVGQVFGEPQTFGETTVIPVAAVTYVFGFGYGSGSTRNAESDGQSEGGSGGGGGGHARARPIAMLEVTPTETRVRPIEDPTRIALAGIALAAWLIWNLFGTLRAIAKARRK